MRQLKITKQVTNRETASLDKYLQEIGKVDFGDAGSAVDTFMIELTPDMLLPYKAYFNDGGLVKKSIIYTPIVPLKRVLSPIGASRW